MIAAKNAVMDNLNVKIEEAIIEQVIRRGTADIGKSYLDCIISAVKLYTEDIFETLRRYEYNADLVRLYIVGGGGCIIRNFYEYDENRVIIIDDICAAAKGYEQIAFTNLRKEAGQNG